MPAPLAGTVAVLVLLAGPAFAQGGDTSQPAETGFPIALLVIGVVAVVLALAWRAGSRCKQNR